MINLGGGLNNIISDVIDDTISGVVKHSKKHKNLSKNNSHDIGSHINQASSNSSDIEAFDAPSSKKKKWQFELENYIRQGQMNWIGG